MSSGVISFFLKVFIPTDKAIYQPVILPNLNNDFLHCTSLRLVAMSPASKAHYREAKNAYSPKFYFD